jgi:hypothetical protein
LPKAFNLLYILTEELPDGLDEEIFRTGTIQEYNVNLSGGSDKSKYFVGMNHRIWKGSF